MDLFISMRFQLPEEYTDQYLSLLGAVNLYTRNLYQLAALKVN